MKDHEIRETVSHVQELCFQFRDSQQLRERIANFLVPKLKAALPSDAAQAPQAVPDMVWLKEDSEQFAHSIDEAVDDYVNANWPVPSQGGEIEFEAAFRLPDVKVRVWCTERVNDDDPGYGWEIVDNAPVAPAAAATDTADAVFRRCLDLEIQNLTVNGSNEITWMAISCRGVVSSLQSTVGAETEDAERYRWLRTHRLFPSTSTFSNAVELDTAIDAARKVRKPSLDQPKAWVAHDTQAARDVLAERVRQVLVEGWTPMHDDQHADGDLALAASVYAASAGGVSWPDSDPYLWPWAREWWKPTTPRRDLVKAAALIIAEIERIDRADSGDENADAQDGAQ